MDVSCRSVASRRFHRCDNRAHNRTAPHRTEARFLSGATDDHRTLFLVVAIVRVAPLVVNRSRCRSSPTHTTHRRHSVGSRSPSSFRPRLGVCLVHYPSIHPSILPSLMLLPCYSLFHSSTRLTVVAPWCSAAQRNATRPTYFTKQ